MGTSVTWNGTSYTVPSTSEENWSGATKVDGLLIALVNHGFQKTGGTFTLSADADFGASAGLKSIYYKSRGTVSTAGILRLANTESIGWRNAANSANVELAVDASNRLTFAGTVVLSSAGVVQIAAGGTGATTAAGGFDALSPMSALGDLIYGGASGTRTRLAGNTTTTKKYLAQTGDGAASAAPTWSQPAFSELSGNATVAQGGTNLTSYTAGDILYATGATTLAKLAIGTASQVLAVNAGATAPEWVSNDAAPDSSYDILNTAIANSVAASALTISLKDKAGSDPSAGSPCKIGFRNATAGTGTYSQVSVSSSLSVTIRSGDTLGFKGGDTNYLYVYAVNNAGTVLLAVTATRLDEGTLQSTTQITGGALTSRTALYASSAVTDKAVRLIARMKFTLTTAGVWDEVADEISLKLSNEYKQERSRVRVNGGNGYGSTNTKVRRFTNTVENTGSDITYADSAGNGATFTINTEGLYHIFYSDTCSTGGATPVVCIGKNIASGSTNPTVTSAEILVCTGGQNVASQTSAYTISTVARLLCNDVLYAYSNGVLNGSTYEEFIVTKLSD